MRRLRRAMTSTPSEETVPLVGGPVGAETTAVNVTTSPNVEGLTPADNAVAA
jgi:hypothetical protein